MGIGISVDHRRKNRSVESLQENVKRLLAYKSKLVIFPKKSGKKGVKKGDTPRSELKNAAQNTLKEIIPIERPSTEVEARAITQADKDLEAYKKVRKARTDKKYLGFKSAALHDFLLISHLNCTYRNVHAKLPQMPHNLKQVNTSRHECQKQTLASCIRPASSSAR